MAEKLKSRAIEALDVFNSGEMSSMTDFLCPDAKFLPPGAPVVEGRDAIVSGMVKSAMHMKDVEQTFVDCEDLDNGYGLVISVFSGCNDKGIRSGLIKNMVIWKQVDGEWYVYRDMINSCQ